MGATSFPVERTIQLSYFRAILSQSPVIGMQSLRDLVDTRTNSTRRKANMSDLSEITLKIRDFRDTRDWMQFHNPKNLACSIVIEAAELLEHFQWKTFEESEEVARDRCEEIAQEIADVAIYLIELADNLGINLIQAIEEKLSANEARYPASKAKGSATKCTELR